MTRAIGVGLDDAGVDGEAFALNQSFGHATVQYRLEDESECIALAEAAMAVLGERRMIGGSAFQAQAAEPSVGQVEMNFVTQPTLRPDAEAVADDEHPDHALGIDRWPAGVAAERRKMLTKFAEIEEAAHASKQVITWDVIVEVECVEELILNGCLTHHDAYLRR